MVEERIKATELLQDLSCVTKKKQNTPKQHYHVIG